MPSSSEPSAPPLWCAGVTSPVVTLFVIVPLCAGAAIAVGTAFHAGVERRFMSRSQASGFAASASVAGPARVPADD